MGAPKSSSYFEGSSLDGGSITLTNQRNAGVCTYTTGDNVCADVTSVQSKSNDVVGETVCMSGWATGYKCGTLRDRDVTVNASGVHLYHQRQWSDKVNFGDSGAPMFNGGLAKGVMSSMDVNTQIGYYSHIGYLASYFSGFSVATTSNCC